MKNRLWQHCHVVGKEHCITTTTTTTTKTTTTTTRTTLAAPEVTKRMTALPLQAKTPPAKTTLTKRQENTKSP